MSARVLLGSLLALSLGCMYSADRVTSITACASDDECSGDQVCFPDGCGDPGTGIVVELLPNASGGQLIQDIPISRLQAVQDLTAGQPSVIQGTMEQDAVSGAIAYQGEVTFAAHGESLLIPGRTRSVTWSVVPENGAFQVAMHSGRFTVTLTPKDSVYPPRTFLEQRVDPGDATTLDVTFPSVSKLLQVRGALLKTLSPRTPVLDAPMDVQAFDDQTGQQISQRAMVSSGTSVSDGSFVLWIEPREGMKQVLIKATPRTAGALAPSKSFLVPVTANAGELELGDFGEQVVITGKVVARTSGMAIPDARVHVEGTVDGGGNFKSPTTTTTTDGTFTLTTLPSGFGGHLAVVVEPPVKSDAGQVRFPVQIPRSGGDVGQVVAPDKVELLGSLARPDGVAASGVVVQAEPLDSLTPDLPTPLGITETTTDETGSFSLKLNPGDYRLDFLPTDQFPRVSRFVRVDPPVGYTGEGYAPISLPQFTLSRGRTVTGMVKSIPRRLTTEFAPAPYASVKFFRVVRFGGKPSSILLAEGVADQNGQYKVVLPTR